MTTTQSLPARPAVRPSAGRARDLLTSEWTKLCSVRSTYLLLLIATGTAMVLGSLISSMIASARANPAPGPLGMDPLAPTFVSLPYAALAAGLLGILAFSSEHATGQIRTTFAAVPNRRAVLAAKTAVIAAVTLAVGELLAFALFFATQAILSGHRHGFPLSHPGVPRAVLAEGTLLCICAMLGTGLGAIIRHTAGSVAALVGTIALPAVLLVLPAPWGDRIGRFTLLYAARQAAALHPRPDLFSPALSLLVLLAWPAVTLLAAAVAITRRDT